MSKPAQQPHASTARYLGFAGLLPFVAALLFLVLAPEPAMRHWVLQAIVAYSALIITFISAIHWGMAIHIADAGLSRVLVIAVIPSLVAWLTVLLPEKFAIPILFFGFLIWHAYERQSYDALQYPEWLRLLRSQLSYSVSGCLLLLWLLSLFNFPVSP